MVKNASYILTDSFHGLSFSINLERQFVVFKRFSDDDKISQNSRIYNILRKLQLENRLISSDQSVSFLIDNIIDYSLVRPLLESERERSLEFLSRSINSVINKK